MDRFPASRLLALTVVVLSLVSGCAFSPTGLGFKAYEKDHYDEALVDFEQGTDEGEKAAAVMAGFMLSSDFPLPIDLPKARHYLDVARQAEGFSEQALDYYLPILEAQIELHNDSPYDDTSAIQRLRRQSYRDDVGVLWMLSAAYADGRGVKQNFALSKQLAQHALDVDPEYIAESYAWYLVTHPDAQYRDLGLARSLLEHWPPQDHDALLPDYWDTWAALYAEQGDFDQAVATEQKALRQLHDKSDQYSYYSHWTPAFEKHLKAYQAHHPWRKHTAYACLRECGI